MAFRCLAALLVALCVGASPGCARSIHGASGATPAFNGNPNANISAINIGGGIVTSRDSDGSTYQVPFFIQVSASAITATGTSAPYEDLSYSWRFLENGVVVCTDTFTRPTDGTTVCPATDQRGPEAAYVKRTTGTLRAELTITGCAGSVGSPNTSGQGICASLYGPVVVTKDFTVNAFGGADKYADQNGTPAGADGSLAKPWTALSDINTALTAGNVALHIKPNSHWVTTSGGCIKIDPGSPVSNVRIDANFPSASGAAPICEATSSAEAPLKILNGSVAGQKVSDVVISGINFITNTTTNITVGSIGGNASNVAGDGAMTNIYLDNVNFTRAVDCASGFCELLGMPGPNSTDHVTVGKNFGLWNVNNTASTSFTRVSIGEDGSAANWHFKMAGTITGPGESTTLDHHIYNEIWTHGLYQWVTCGPTGSGAGQRAYCFNGNYDGILSNPNDHITVQYITYNENSCQYTILCVDLGNRTNNSAGDSTVQYQYVVISNNAMINMGPESFECGLSVTLRDNRYWGVTASQPAASSFFVPPNAQSHVGYTQGANLLSKLYRNKIYMTSVGYTGDYIVQYQGTWTVPQVVSDNTIVDARITGRLISLTWSDQLASGSSIVRDVYSSIPVFTTSWYDGTTGKTFAQWQAAGSTPSRWDPSPATNLAGATPAGWTLPVTQWSHMGP